MQKKIGNSRLFFRERNGVIEFIIGINQMPNHWDFEKKQIKISSLGSEI